MCLSSAAQGCGVTCHSGCCARAELLSPGTRSGKREQGGRRHVGCGEGVEHVPCVGETQDVVTPVGAGESGVKL